MLHQCILSKVPYCSSDPIDGREYIVVSVHNHIWAHKHISTVIQSAVHESQVACKASEGSVLGRLPSFHCQCLAKSKKLLFFLFLFFNQQHDNSEMDDLLNKKTQKSKCHLLFKPPLASNNNEDKRWSTMYRYIYIYTEILMYTVNTAYSLLSAAD